MHQQLRIGNHNDLEELQAAKINIRQNSSFIVLQHRLRQGAHSRFQWNPEGRAINFVAWMYLKHHIVFRSVSLHFSSVAALPCTMARPLEAVE
jgi:hypothetical protein